MPLHDWTRTDAGVFHNFHRGWTVELRRQLNRGLPPGYSALLQCREEPQATTSESDAAFYTRRADQISIRNHGGSTVAVIAIVSPGDKESRDAIELFANRAHGHVKAGVNLQVIDLFPPTPHDRGGMHSVIWSKSVDEAFTPPECKPLTIASYEAGDKLTAYVDTIGVGDELPDAPLFLARGHYVGVPLQRTYDAEWYVTPQDIRDEVTSAPPPA